MTNEQIHEIALDDISPAPGNRTVGGFDRAKLDQLAESIKAIGVQQPAVVRVIGDGKYELVAGERRWRASKLAGVPTLPCVIRDLNDETALRIRIIENLQREDVHPLDEAEGYARLEKEGHCEVEYIAQQVGRSTAYVYQRLRLLSLIPKVRKILIDGRMTVGHALLIARLPPNQQEEALDLATYGRGSVGADEGIRSVKNLDDVIRSNILMQLSAATWKLDDAKLYPKAGSCKDCSKRSGAAPLLFGDIGKKDQCLDKDCFAEKRRLLIEAKMLEIKNEPHIFVKQTYSDKAPEGSIDHWEWTECKKKDPGAVHTLIVTGPDSGKLTWGKSKFTESGKRVITPEKKAAKAREKKILAAGIELREKLFAGIALATVPEIPEALLIEAVKESWRQMNRDAKRLLSKQLQFVKRPGKYMDDRYEGDFQGYLVGKGRQELETMRIMILYAGNLFLSNADYLSLHEGFISAATAAGIDVAQEVAAIAKGKGLTPKELNPPARSYESEIDDESEDGSEV
ncbi:MAG: ParB/RepB/Spo0J family partition protein [Rectinemataceae bacterium]